MTTPIAVVDALVLALSAQMGATAVDRLEEIRKLKTEYGKQLKGEKRCRIGRNPNTASL